MNEATTILDGIKRALEIANQEGLNPSTIYLNPIAFKVLDEQVRGKYPMVDTTKMHGVNIQTDSSVEVGEVAVRDSTVPDGVIHVDM